MWVCKPDTEIPFLLKQRQMNICWGSQSCRACPCIDQLLAACFKNYGSLSLGDWNEDFSMLCFLQNLNFVRDLAETSI